MANEGKRINFKKCIAVTSGNYFYKDEKKGWQVRECYKDKPTARVDKKNLSLITSTRKDKKIYLGDFSELNNDVKGYAIDKMFNYGEKNVDGIYLVEAEKPTKKKVNMAMNNYYTFLNRKNKKGGNK